MKYDKEYKKPTPSCRRRLSRPPLPSPTAPSRYRRLPNVALGVRHHPPPSVPLPLVHGRREKSTTATTVIVVVDAHPPASMPGLGATDPANLEAQARAELGFSRRLEQP